MKVKPGKSILIYFIYTSTLTILFECVTNVFKIIHEDSLCAFLSEAAFSRETLALHLRVRKTEELRK